MRDHTDDALKAARKLRSEISLPEVMLWQILKQRPLGLKFRRQHPAGSYVADFYCASARTIIEIDGIAHDMGSRPARDAARNDWLLSQGYKVVRIPATDVLKDVDGVAQSIVAMCAAVPPPSALRAATSPDGGGSVRSR